MPQYLGRVVPRDFDHVAKYPLSALPPALQPRDVPLVLGCNWMTNFDNPVKDPDGSWWVGRGDLGTIRGGHCVCLAPVLDMAEQDLYQRWWRWYDQGQEGACVGFGCSRVQSLVKRKTFDGFWLYHQAQAIDGNPLPHEGTEVRCGLEVLRTKGHVLGAGAVDTDNVTGVPDQQFGINAYRWTDVPGALAAVGTPHLDYFEILNSWGRDYPHFTRIPATVVDRLLKEGGEIGVVTER